MALLLTREFIFVSIDLVPTMRARVRVLARARARVPTRRNDSFARKVPGAARRGLSSIKINDAHTFLQCARARVAVG